jgi:hypothetical protein
MKFIHFDYTINKHYLNSLKMLQFMSYLDFFGVTFNFTTYGHTKFRSPLGGLLTMICAIVIIIFGIFFGMDFFTKKNPKVIQQTVYPDDYLPPIKISPENILFPWRLVDSYSRPVDFEGKIFPRLSYLKYVQNSTGTILVAYSNLKIEKCNSKNIQIPEFSNKFNISEYYCVDWSDGNYTFGGNFDGNYVDYFHLDFSFCKDSLVFTNNTFCSDFNSLLPFFYNQVVFFEVLYPETYFVPEESGNSTKINLKNYNFPIDPKLVRLDRISFTKLQILDDIGWILEDVRTYERYGVVERRTDYLIFDLKYYNQPGVNSIFYSAVFYSVKYYTSIKRSYMKIQDLAALIGGFIKIIILIAGFLAQIYNLYYRDEKLYNIFFFFEDSPQDAYKISNNLSPLKLSKASKIECFPYNMSENKNFQNKVHVFPNFNKHIEDNKNNPEKNENSIKGYIKLGLCFEIKRIMRISKNKDLIQFYNNIKRYFKERLDFVFYLKHLKKMEIIKSLLFNQHQLLYVDRFNKVNLSDNVEFLNNEEQIPDRNKQIVEYFQKKKQMNQIEEIDKKILDKLEPEIKSMISKT